MIFCCLLTSFPLSLYSYVLLPNASWLLNLLMTGMPPWVNWLSMNNWLFSPLWARSSTSRLSPPSKLLVSWVLLSFLFRVPDVFFLSTPPLAFWLERPPKFGASVRSSSEAVCLLWLNGFFPINRRFNASSVRTVSKKVILTPWSFHLLLLFLCILAIIAKDRRQLDKIFKVCLCFALVSQVQ